MPYYLVCWSGGGSGGEEGGSNICHASICGRKPNKSGEEGRRGEGNAYAHDMLGKLCCFLLNHWRKWLGREVTPYGKWWPLCNVSGQRLPVSPVKMPTGLPSLTPDMPYVVPIIHSTCLWEETTTVKPNYTMPSSNYIYIYIMEEKKMKSLLYDNILNNRKRHYAINPNYFYFVPFLKPETCPSCIIPLIENYATLWQLPWLPIILLWGKQYGSGGRR